MKLYILSIFILSSLHSYGQGVEDFQLLISKYQSGINILNDTLIHNEQDLSNQYKLVLNLFDSKAALVINDLDPYANGAIRIQHYLTKALLNKSGRNISFSYVKHSQLGKGFYEVIFDKVEGISTSQKIMFILKNSIDDLRISAIQKFRDQDGDLIQDSYDDCPEIPGSIQGCPDLDRDGVKDSEDECPSRPGTLQNKGCPENTSVIQKGTFTPLNNDTIILVPVIPPPPPPKPNLWKAHKPYIISGGIGAAIWSVGYFVPGKSAHNLYEKYSDYRSPDEFAANVPDYSSRKEAYDAVLKMQKTGQDMVKIGKYVIGGTAVFFVFKEYIFKKKSSSKSKEDLSFQDSQTKKPKIELGMTSISLKYTF